MPSMPTRGQDSMAQWPGRNMVSRKLTTAFRPAKNPTRQAASSWSAGPGPLSAPHSPRHHAEASATPPPWYKRQSVLWRIAAKGPGAGPTGLTLVLPPVGPVFCISAPALFKGAEDNSWGEGRGSCGSAGVAQGVSAASGSLWGHVQLPATCVAEFAACSALGLPVLHLEPDPLHHIPADPPTAAGWPLHAPASLWGQLRGPISAPHALSPLQGWEGWPGAWGLPPLLPSSASVRHLGGALGPSTA